SHAGLCENESNEEKDGDCTINVNLLVDGADTALPTTILVTDSPSFRSSFAAKHPRTHLSAPIKVGVLGAKDTVGQRFVTLLSVHPWFVVNALGHLSAPIKVGVLGAKDTVGQRFVTLLSVHPWFVVNALGVSLRSAGKPYRLAVNWKQSMPVPQAVQEVMGLDADVAGEAFRAEDLAVFSNAKNFRWDLHVPLIVSLVNSLSSCSSRCCSRHLLQCEELPLGPTRPAHCLAREHGPPRHHPAAAGAVLAAAQVGLHCDQHELLHDRQQALFSPPLKSGFIVTNTNCSTTGYVIPLAAMERVFRPLEAVMVTTMQACRP
ncbi:LOW QUALITY PROTEIN: hypothetical protein CVT25_012665, partial [Psilocybe cyanescens]